MRAQDGADIEVLWMIIKKWLPCRCVQSANYDSPDLSNICSLMHAICHCHMHNNDNSYRYSIFDIRYWLNDELFPSDIIQSYRYCLFGLHIQQIRRKANKTENRSNPQGAYAFANDIFHGKWSPSQSKKKQWNNDIAPQSMWSITKNSRW